MDDGGKAAADLLGERVGRVNDDGRPPRGVA